MVSPPSGERSWASFTILVVSPTPTHPQDHGNRKRIFEICTQLKRRGARVEFVHYPGEHDWRDRWPRRREDDMRAAWDSYHLVPPSRELHVAALGEDHEIDEWADPSLKSFIAWACRTRAYDAVLVNYTWMSFCLEAVPKGVFKICDTHDVFGGRRRLLEDNGVQAEFFHTTKAQEALGLERADLVWAIKPSEEAYFRTELNLPNCLTVLHAEPERDVWSEPPSKDGWLRAGVIGAKNSINKRNMEAFLTEALPVLESYMAPVKILIAGGLSDEFQSWKHPNLEVVGRLDEVETFYRQVDVVLAPIRFSTGLKIKVSEALASGAPLIALAHAMEGYPTKEPLHRLHNFADMAMELVKLSFDRTPLVALARRSRSVCSTISRSVSAALDETLSQLASTQAATICFVVPAEAFDPSNLLHDHLLEALDYLRFVSGIAIFARGKPPRAMNFDFLRAYELRPQIFVDPELAAAIGEQAPEFWTPISLAELLSVRGYRRIYLMADCGDEILISMSALQQVIVRHDAIEIAGGDADGIIETLRCVADLVLVSCEHSHVSRWRDVAGIAEIVVAPFRRNGVFASLERRGAGVWPKPLLILARRDDPIAEEVLRLAARLGWEGVIVDPAAMADRDQLLGRNLPASADALAGFSNIKLVVDMTEDDPISAVIGEAAIRKGVPRLSFQRGARAIGLHAFATPLKPTSIGRLLGCVADCATTPAALEQLRRIALNEAETRYKHDAGWSVLWGLGKAHQPA